MTPRTIELRPGIDAEEAGFVGSILNAPEDDTARKAFADWLDEHARPVEAKYLRDVRRHKFVRLVHRRGWWALYPEWARVMPPHPMKRKPIKPGGFWDFYEPGKPVTSYPDLRNAMKAVMAAVDLQHQPPPGHSIMVPLSDRCKAWIEKFKRGWRPPKHTKRNGWSTRVGYYGVYDWELLHIIDKLVPDE